MRDERPIPAAVNRIVLTGFMGAGKSTIGPLVAERLGWRFVDADDQIQTQQQTSIAALFTRIGEAAFRRLEAEVVASLLSQREVVISLGGGAIETNATRLLLAETPGTCVVFLKASLEVLVDRCERQPGAADRPVLRQRDTLSLRFDSRQPHYEAAHIVVDTETLNPAQAADCILRFMVEASFPVPSNPTVTPT